MGIANSATAFGKELWPQKSIYNNLLEESPILGVIPKDEDFGEDIRHHYVNYQGATGLAGTFAEAKAYRNSSKRVKFEITTRSFYGNFAVDGAVWRRFEFTGNKGLIQDEVARNSKDLMQNARNIYSSAIHGNGVGVLARMTAASTPTSSATVTLRELVHGRRVEPGMTLQTEATGATGGTINSGYVTVSSVQGTEDAPTVTVEQANWAAGIASVAASDYIYLIGTYDAMFYGLDAWLPDHSGSPGTFLGANRNLYAKRLAGHTLDLSSTPMDPMARMVRASRIVKDAGFKADTYLMSTRNWEQLYTQLAAQGKLRMTKVPAAKIGSMSFGISYDAIEFVGPGGTCQVFADAWMADNVERCGQRDLLRMSSTGPMLHWDDGSTPGKPRVENDQDARECRLVGDNAFFLEDPFGWCRIKLPS